MTSSSRTQEFVCHGPGGGDEKERETLEFSSGKFPRFENKTILTAGLNVVYTLFSIYTRIHQIISSISSVTLLWRSGGAYVVT
jgi:hypothetical protein